LPASPALDSFTAVTVPDLPGDRFILRRHNWKSSSRIDFLESIIKALEQELSRSTK
jgi:hypothetical protein